MDSSLTLGIKDSARALGVGRTHLYRLINDGKIDTILLGRRRLVTTASLRKLVEEATARRPKIP
ncbi:MAG: helix-turn-helix domain-containing protein [Croceibacterium sp.]